jgi:hypothetical protein
VHIMCSHGHPTKGDTPACGLGRVLTTPYRKKGVLQNVTHDLGLAFNILVSKPKERDCLEDLGVDGILKWISGK